MDRDRAYHCSECCRGFKEFVIFEGHFSFYQECRESIGSYMQCYICKEEFYNLAALKYHIRSHENQFYEIDSTTNTQISSRQYYTAVLGNGSNRINNETSENDVDQNAFPTYAGPETINHNCCSVCGKGFSTKFHLKEHSITHSSIVAACKHEISGIDSPQRSAKKGLDHPSNDKNEVKSERIKASGVTISANKKKGRVYQCSLCKAKLSSKDNMQRHQKLHAYGTMDCKICKVKFTKVAMIRHQREFHPKFFNSKCSSKYRQCPVCKIKFYGSNIHRHKKMHYSGTTTCKICKIKFTDDSFVQHEKQCSSTSIERERCEKPVEIEQSKDHEQMNSTTNVSLKKTEIKGPVRCSICKAKISCSNNLRRHMKLHKSGTATCNICNIKFSPITLARHNKLHHPHIQQIHKCNLCKLTFLTRRYLLIHLKSPQHLNKVDNDAIVIKTEESGEVPDIVKPVDVSNVRAHVEVSNNGAQLDHLNENKKTHSTIQQWIDLATVYLSNWSPEKSQEILRNQPLVLVEKLNIGRIDLKSLNDFIQRTERQIGDLFTTDSQRLEPDAESVPSDLLDLNDSFPSRYVTFDATERNENDFSEWEDLHPTLCDLVDDRIASDHDYCKTKQAERIQDASFIHSTYKVENVNEDCMNSSNLFNKDCTDSNAVTTIEISSESDDDDMLMISKTF